MSRPMLSIVIANYNYGRFLERAIQSVVEQDLDGQVELIICDGGSTDESVDIIEQYKGHVAWWCSEKDAGQSDAFNKGFSHAHGRFGCWLNADDFFAPGALWTILKYIERHPNVEWLGGSSIFVDHDLNVKWCSRCIRTPKIGCKYVPYYTVNGPSSVFLLDNLKKVGGFDTRLRYTMDTDLWRRFAAAGISLHFVKNYIWVFRIHESSKTSHRFITGKSISPFAKENADCNSRYGISPFRGRLGCRINQLLRLVSGTYLISYYDTIRSRGRSYLTLF